MRPNKARARYGTGDFLKLNKRECGISIELIPCGADFLKVNWCIGGDNHTLWASSAMGYQFSSFVGAVYDLYSEDYDTHSNHLTIGHKSDFFSAKEDPSLQEDEIKVQSRFSWNGESYPWTDITFTRKCNHWNYPVIDGEDTIEISIDSTSEDRSFRYTVDGRDLCYAVAKAVTEAIKKHGFYGYFMSTGGDCNGRGDLIDMHMLIFIKAYALGVMEVRKLEVAWKSETSRWQGANRTPFDKEVELLLFDM